tara:strand:+ start:364 stop:594 length:231 start_codon:yes stop_codon:yes gene_type:complete
MEEKLMDIHAVANMMSLGHQSARKLIRISEDFPKAIILGERIRRWKQNEIIDWMETKRTEDDIHYEIASLSKRHVE